MLSIKTAGCSYALSLVVIATCLLIPPCTAIGKENQLPKDLQAQFHRLGFGVEGVSIFVQAIEQNSPILLLQADEPRNPASVIKLVTTAAALDKLGPGFTWKTEVYRDGTVKNDVLNGNLYIKGYGDPFMTAEYFWRFLRSIRNTGIAHIQGNLVLDTSYFLPDEEDPGDFDGKPLRAYNVSPNALLVNFQSIRFEFSPDLANASVSINAFPKLATFEIANKLSIRQGSCGNWKAAILMQIVPQLDLDQVQFSGRYGADCDKQSMYRVVNNPQRYFDGIFHLIWNELGGKLDGKVQTGIVPIFAKQVHTETSLPLADLLRGINKFSNNVMTKQLLLTLAAEIAGAPGSRQKGIELLHAWLRQRGLFTDKTVLANGAGLARETRISARQLGALLIQVFNEPYMPEFISSLPISSVDGTMRHRFNGSQLRGRMHIKTGTLDFVRTMAGYVLSRSGKRYAVVMLHNHARAHTYKAEKLQDIILNWVYAQ
jgi:D-alanyl-D-alanine carboxypeptidase/D-alanyl-D-alanine-endopeptidase (penicillin-binding protein 4)